MEYDFIDFFGQKNKAITCLWRVHFDVLKSILILHIGLYPTIIIVSDVEK